MENVIIIPGDLNLNTDNVVFRKNGSGESVFIHDNHSYCINITDKNKNVFILKPLMKNLFFNEKINMENNFQTNIDNFFFKIKGKNPDMKKIQEDFETSKTLEITNASETYNQNTPETLNNQNASETYNQNAPENINEKNSVLNDDPIKCASNRNATEILYNHNSPEILYNQNSPEILYNQSSTENLYNQSSTENLYNQNSTENLLLQLNKKIEKIIPFCEPEKMDFEENNTHQVSGAGPKMYDYEKKINIEKMSGVAKKVDVDCVKHNENKEKRKTNEIVSGNEKSRKRSNENADKPRRKKKKTEEETYINFSKKFDKLLRIPEMENVFQKTNYANKSKEENLDVYDFKEKSNRELFFETGKLYKNNLDETKKTSQTKFEEAKKELQNTLEEAKKELQNKKDIKNKIDEKKSQNNQDSKKIEEIKKKEVQKKTDDIQRKSKDVQKKPLDTKVYQKKPKLVQDPKNFQNKTSNEIIPGQELKIQQNKTSNEIILEQELKIQQNKQLQGTEFLQDSQVSGSKMMHVLNKQIQQMKAIQEPKPQNKTTTKNTEHIFPNKQIIDSNWKLSLNKNTTPQELKTLQNKPVKMAQVNPESCDQNKLVQAKMQQEKLIQNKQTKTTKISDQNKNVQTKTQQDKPVPKQTKMALLNMLPDQTKQVQSKIANKELSNQHKPMKMKTNEEETQNVETENEQENEKIEQIYSSESSCTSFEDSSDSEQEVSENDDELN